MKSTNRGFGRKRASAIAVAIASAALCATALTSSAQTPLSPLHRWSFTTDGTDSVGGATATLVGTADFSGGELQLPGGGTFANYASISISNTLSTNVSLTVETWFTMTALQNWSKVWMFGHDAEETALSYINLTPRRGDNTFPKIDFNTATGNEISATATSPLVEYQQYYAVTVYDAANNTASLYIDGNLIASVSMGGGNITQLNADTMRLGGGFHFADPDLSGSINEMRIYGGALGNLQIAVNALNGPDTLDTAITVNSIAFDVTSRNVSIGDLQDTTITFNTATYGSITVTNSSDVTYEVSNPSILAVSANGRVSALSPGVATVTAKRGSLASSKTITVADVALALEHRYSFNDSDGTVAVDSVNPAWNGVLMNSASIVNNELVLPGGTYSSDPAASYVDLPNGILTNLNSITIETWVTDNESTNWARICDFGNSVGGEDYSDGGEGQSYLILVARNNNGALYSEITQTGSATPANQTLAWANSALPIGTKTHVAYSIDALSTTARLYVNGAEVDMKTNMTVRPRNLGNTVNNWLGRAQFNDPTFNGTIDEFRIWNRALGKAHMLASTIVGPDFVLTNGTPQSMQVTVPSASMTGGSTQQAAIIANFAQTNGLTITAAASSWSSSDTNVLIVDSKGLITAVGAGSATVSAIVDGATATSSAITIAVVQPTITTQPVSLTRYAGSLAKFSVAGLGGELKYQWKKNGASLANETNSTLVIDGVALADNGAVFTAEVSNAAGKAVSEGATLTVQALNPAHRWSFTTDGTDSIGGVTCVTSGAATIADGSLRLSGGTSRENSGNIAGITNTLNASESLTIEGWMTMSQFQNWAKGWMFGNSSSPYAYIDFTPRAGDRNLPSMSLDVGPTDEVNTRAGTNPEVWVLDKEYYIACVYDATRDTMYMYIDGVLADSASMGGRRPNQMNASEAWLGSAVGFGDPDFNGSFNEIRVWPGPITAAQVAADFAAGPDKIGTVASVSMTISRSGANVTLTWPNGTLQTTPAIGASWTDVTGITSPYTVPATNSQSFFRVRQ